MPHTHFYPELQLFFHGYAVSSEIRIDAIRETLVRQTMGFGIRESHIQMQLFDLLATGELRLCLICKCGKCYLHHEIVGKIDGELVLKYLV